jgi:hypothetical protein
MLRIATALLFIVAGCAASAQDGVLPFRPIVGLNIGVNMPEVEAISGSAFATRPFVAGTLDLGASWTYRDKVGVVAMGMFAMNGYDYAKEGFDYDVYHLTRRLELRPFWQKPLDPGLGTTLRAGLGLGMSYQGNAFRDTRRGPFRSTSRSIADERPFLAPEVSILKELGHHRMELGLRYTRHLQREPAFSTILSLGADTSVASATNDLFGLVLRFHFGLERPALPTLPAPPVDYAARSTDTLTTLATRKERITLWLWDNAEYDGDTLSVFLNGRPVLVGHELTRKRHRLRIDLRPGENHLLVAAHNEGRVPPNTASVLVATGMGRKQLLVSTSLRRNQVVRIEREGGN